MRGSRSPEQRKTTALNPVLCWGEIFKKVISEASWQDRIEYELSKKNLISLGLFNKSQCYCLSFWNWKLVQLILCTFHQLSLIIHKALSVLKHLSRCGLLPPSDCMNNKEWQHVNVKTKQAIWMPQLGKSNMAAVSV